MQTGALPFGGGAGGGGEGKTRRKLTKGVEPTEKTPSVPPLEGAELPHLWPTPLDGTLPPPPAPPREEPLRLTEIAANDEILALDWSFQHIPSEGFHPQLHRSRKAA